MAVIVYKQGRLTRRLKFDKQFARDEGNEWVIDVEDPAKPEDMIRHHIPKVDIIDIQTDREALLDKSNNSTNTPINPITGI